MKDRKTALWLAGLISLIILLPNLIQPFNLDNNLYQTMGWQLVRHHRLPFLGTWDQNFPGIVFYHAAIIALFGTSPVIFRVFDILLQLSVSLLLFYFASRFLAPRFAILAAVFSALIYTAGGSTLSGERDGIAVFFVLISTAILYYCFDDHAKHLFPTFELPLILLSGIIMGLTLTIRPNNVFYLVAPLFILFHNRRTIGGKSWILFFIGVIIPMGVVLLLYALQPHGVHEFYLATIKYNLDLYGNVKYRVPFRQVILGKTELMPDFILLGWAFMVFKDRKKYDERSSKIPYFTFQDKCFAIGYYLSCRISILVMGKFYAYHYAMVYAISAILAADAFSRLSSHLPRLKRIVPWATAIVVLIVLYKTTYVPHVMAAVFRGDTQPLQTAFLSPARSTDDYLLTDRLVNYLERLNPQKEQIECVGFIPSVYWRTKTEPASRFPLMLPWAIQLPAGGFTKYQIRWRKEFMDSISSVKPKFIVVSQFATFLDMLPEVPFYYLHRLPGFDSLLTSNYSFDTTIVPFILYKRRI